MSHEDPQKRRERNRRYYQKNLARETVRSMDKRRLLIVSIKALLLEHLQTHPCVDCGESDPVVLEFDHVDPKMKRFTMAEARRGKKRPKAVIDELKKCEVRCANCHRRRTARQAVLGEIRFGISIRNTQREALGTTRKVPDGH